MKDFKKIAMIVVAGTLLATTSCSDFDDYNTVNLGDDLTASKTLWENINSNPDLTDFASIIKKVGYDTKLDSACNYTVWAPVNSEYVDSINKSLDDPANKDVTIKKFLKNHIANYAHYESDANDTIIYMLNGKLLNFEGKNTGNLTFDEVAVKENTQYAGRGIYNYPCVNGVLYTLSSATKYRNNLFDFLLIDNKKTTLFTDYLTSYNDTILDTENSVKGDIVNGVQQYDELVYNTGNRLIGTDVSTGSTGKLRALLDDEDSTYVVLIPTDEVWTEQYNEISSYFNYISPMYYQDLTSDEIKTSGGRTPKYTTKSQMRSAKTTVLHPDQAKTSLTLSAPTSPAQTYWTDSLTKTYLSADLIYSMNNHKYNDKLDLEATSIGNDSVYSTSRHYRTGIQNIRNSIESTEQLSNGYAYFINQFPFNSWDRSGGYAPEIKTNNVMRIYPTSASLKTMSIPRSIAKNYCTLESDVTSLTYVKVTPDNNNDIPELDFKIPNVLSTTYEVYVVTVPASIEGNGDEDKPYSLRADVSYCDASGVMQVARFDPSKTDDGVTTLQVNTVRTGANLISPSTKLKQIPDIITRAGHESVLDTLYLGEITFGICYAGTVAYPNIKILQAIEGDLTEPFKYDHTLRVANVILRPKKLDDADPWNKEN